MELINWDKRELLNALCNLVSEGKALLEGYAIDAPSGGTIRISFDVYLSQAYQREVMERMEG